MTTFKCDRCKQIKPVAAEGGTGYAIDEPAGKRYCYACCAEIDREHICAEIDREHMREHGKITLYLTSSHEVTNWPGTLRFPAWGYKSSPHNIAGKRYDVWFNGPDGHVWHGVQYGENTQICHCKRTKELT